MDEEPLFGGEVNDTVRVGDTVRRKTGPWAPTVHALLGYLASQGFPCPRVLGIDDQGREVLEYIPGRAGYYPWTAAMRSGDSARKVGQLLRRYHDAVADFDPGPHPRWRSGTQPLRAGEVICHNDAGPWNVIWRGGEPVALIDFDLAAPGPAAADLGYALWFHAPFRPDIDMIGFDCEPPRRERAAALLEGYGWRSGEDAVHLVVDSMDREYATMRALSSRGVYPWTAFVEKGLDLRNRAHRSWLLQARF